MVCFLSRFREKLSGIWGKRGPVLRSWLGGLAAAGPLLASLLLPWLLGALGCGDFLATLLGILASVFLPRCTPLEAAEKKPEPEISLATLRRIYRRSGARHPSFRALALPGQSPELHTFMRGLLSPRLAAASARRSPGSGLGGWRYLGEKAHGELAGEPRVAKVLAGFCAAPAGPTGLLHSLVSLGKTAVALCRHHPLLATLAAAGALVVVWGVYAATRPTPPADTTPPSSPSPTRSNSPASESPASLLRGDDVRVAAAAGSPALDFASPALQRRLYNAVYERLGDHARTFFTLRWLDSPGEGYQGRGEKPHIPTLAGDFLLLSAAQREALAKDGTRRGDVAFSQLLAQYLDNRSVAPAQRRALLPPDGSATDRLRGYAAYGELARLTLLQAEQSNISLENLGLKYSVETSSTKATAQLAGYFIRHKMTDGQNLTPAAKETLRSLLSIMQLPGGVWAEDSRQDPTKLLGQEGFLSVDAMLVLGQNFLFR